jgi:hypothetical protein
MFAHDPLIYVHIGDLHITEALAQNFMDFRAIVSEVAALFARDIDFVYLPGDNADNGKAHQYQLIASELKRLQIQVHIITGDHDMEPGDLTPFAQHLSSRALPEAAIYGDVRCLFLDMCGSGRGGPDFRLGQNQIDWLIANLQEARVQGQRAAVFMHSYPVDLKTPGEGEAVRAALAQYEALLVDMGHTHYNELANDTRTIYAATRSTGQIEEGPVGYAIVAIDGPVVSWRFRQLGARGPLVCITSPADRRLATRLSEADAPARRRRLRVSVFSRTPIVSCTYRIDGGPAQVLPAIDGRRYEISLSLDETAREILVEAVDAEGHSGYERIELATPNDWQRSVHADASDRDAIGPWIERDIFGTQLGPNRNGRQW